MDQELTNTGTTAEETAGDAGDEDTEENLEETDPQEEEEEEEEEEEVGVLPPESDDNSNNSAEAPVAQGFGSENEDNTSGDGGLESIPLVIPEQVDSESPNDLTINTDDDKGDLEDAGMDVSNGESVPEIVDMENTNASNPEEIDQTEDDKELEHNLTGEEAVFEQSTAESPKEGSKDDQEVLNKDDDAADIGPASLLVASTDIIESDEESEMPMIRVKQFGLFAEEADDDDQEEQLNVPMDPDDIQSMMQVEMNEEDTGDSNSTTTSTSTRPRRAAAAAAANVIREITTLESESRSRRKSRDIESDYSEGMLVTSGEKQRCHTCKRACVSKITVRQYGQDVYFCTQVCFNIFRNPETAARRNLPCAKCGIIQRDTGLTTTYYWETMNFCSDLCVGNYQIEIGAKCATCQKKVAWSSLGKYCVRFGSDVKQFCTALCLESYKKNARVCFHCQLDVKKLNNVILANIPAKSSPKEFCSQDCVEMYIEQNLQQTVRHKPNQNSMCFICSTVQSTFRELVLSTGNFKVCSETCFNKLIEVKNVRRPVKCEICSKFLNLELGLLAPAFYVSAKKKVHGFCSATCKNVYVLRSRQILACTTCKVKKYNYDLIEHINENDVTAFAVCSLNCIPKPSQYIINLRQTLTPNSASEIVGKRVNQDRPQQPTLAQSRIRTKILANNGTQQDNHSDVNSNGLRIASVASLATEVNSELAKTSNDDIYEDADKVVNISEEEMNEIMSSIDSCIVFPPKEPVEQRNKGCLVRPFTKTVGTLVDPEITGVDTTVREKYIPFFIPVPVYVPFPFYGLESPAPIPFPVPLPVPMPVPIIFPTESRNSTNANIQSAIPPATINTTPYVGNSSIEPPQPPLTSTAVLAPSNEIPVGMTMDTVPFLDTSVFSGGPNVGESDSFDILNTIPNLEMELGLGSSHHHASGVNHMMSQSTAIPGTGNMTSSSCSMLGNVIPSSDGSWRQNQQTVLRGMPKIPLHTGQTREEFALREWARIFGHGQNVFCMSEKLLCEKLTELAEKGRHISGDRYQPYFILYMCLGLQQHLRINNRNDKLFYDASYENFIQTFVSYTEAAYNQGICEAGVQENDFWDSHELGVNSPEVLVFTLVYYNYKFFQLRTWQEHAALMFDQLVISTKTGPSGQRYKSLTYIAPHSPANGIEIPEMEPTTKCFIKLLEFYKFKCTCASGAFYKAIIPQSPLKGKWYMMESLSQLDIYRMLIRAMMIQG